MTDTIVVKRSRSGELHYYTGGTIRIEATDARTGKRCRPILANTSLFEGEALRLSPLAARLTVERLTTQGIGGGVWLAQPADAYSEREAS